METTAHCHPSSPTLATSAQATVHCLSGCVIGEVAGLMIGVTLGLDVVSTVILATILAYVSGFTLGLVPVVRRERVSYAAAFRLIWLGELVSIGAMEIAMNGADYLAGGMTAGSVWSTRFWFGVGLALPAGFLAAWPVNAWLLARNLKRCH